MVKPEREVYLMDLISVSSTKFRNKEDGTEFTVVKAKRFEKHNIRKYRQYLMSLSDGKLVGVYFYGQLVPLITVTTGVEKLTQVTVGKKLLRTAAEISKALGIKKPKKPVPLVLVS